MRYFSLHPRYSSIHFLAVFCNIPLLLWHAPVTEAFQWQVFTQKPIAGQRGPKESARGMLDRVGSVHSSSLQMTMMMTNSKSKSSNPSDTAEFEYQEMKIQLDAMMKSGISARNLNPTTRRELETYVRQVAMKRKSLPFGTLNSNLKSDDGKSRDETSRIDPTDLAASLPGTSWRLAFSTEPATLESLPKDATVFLKFLDGSTLEYVLQFGQRTFGLNNLKARSSWSIDLTSGIISFVYDQITCDMLGIFKDVTVGLFGLLKGRVNYVATTYLDGTYWIERSFDPNGDEYYNVYVREE